jgi:hypothetical protein
VLLLYVEGCPHWRTTEERLRQALSLIGRPDVAIEHRTVDTPEAAEQIGFRGSPTVLVDGGDPFLDADAPVGLSCRVYRTEEGLAGSPTVEQFVEVLRGRRLTARRSRRGVEAIVRPTQAATCGPRERPTGTC